MIPSSMVLTSTCSQANSIASMHGLCVAKRTKLAMMVENKLILPTNLLSMSTDHYLPLENRLKKYRSRIQTATYESKIQSSRKLSLAIRQELIKEETLWGTLMKTLGRRVLNSIKGTPINYCSKNSCKTKETWMCSWAWMAMVKRDSKTITVTATCIKRLVLESQVEKIQWIWLSLLGVKTAEHMTRLKFNRETTPQCQCQLLMLTDLPKLQHLPELAFAPLTRQPCLLPQPVEDSNSQVIQAKNQNTWVVLVKRRSFLERANFLSYPEAKWIWWASSLHLTLRQICRPNKWVLGKTSEDNRLSTSDKLTVTKSTYQINHCKAKPKWILIIL